MPTPLPKAAAQAGARVDRKAAILVAAINRIVAGGLAGLRVRDVAGDVGINNATLHHHFPTKAALVAALVQRFLAGFKEAGIPPADRLQGGSLEARLAAYVASRRAMMARDPASFHGMCELLVLARRDEEVRALLAGLQAGWREAIAAMCRESGLDEPAALERADRCRREILGLCLDLGLE